MKVVRGFERRLERILEGVAGKVFSGRLHPAEIANRLAREADFARFDHETGPATANLYKLMVHPSDLTTDPGGLGESLTAELEQYTSEEGLRLEGPCRVVIEPAEQVPPGSLVFHVEVSPGPPVPWARLVGEESIVDVGRNRAMVGRGETADVLIPHDEISRKHALVWREGGRAWVIDLGSSNGTTLDGLAVDGDPRAVEPGAVIGFAGHRYRWAEL